MKWKKECGKCVQRNRFVDRSRENFLLKKGLFDGCKNLTIVPCSEWMGNFVKESFLKEKHVEVIHNGVDLTVFKWVSSVSLLYQMCGCHTRENWTSIN